MQRVKALSIVLIIYVLAFLIGFYAPKVLGIETLLMRALAGTIFATIYIFLFSTVLKNSSVYDPYWSVQPLVIVPFFVAEVNVAVVLMLVLIGFWGIRLTVNWAYTFTGFDYQDWRYIHYKNKFPKLWPVVNFFGIHFMPTMIVFLVLLPATRFVYLAPSVNILTVIFFLFGVLAVCIQLISDIQMHKHRKRSNAVLDTGLWRLSRHPNYFGEITVWFMVALMLISVEIHALVYGLGALLNLLMFMRISIPLMETRQRAKRADYEAYINKTSMLVPWRSKNESIAATKKA